MLCGHIYYEKEYKNSDLKSGSIKVEEILT
jgi:hypothetical protein